MGKEVHIVVDGVSSQQPFDREIALQRMSNAGAFLTTAQSIAFMLMQSKYEASELEFFYPDLFVHSHSFVFMNQVRIIPSSRKLVS